LAGVLIVLGRRWGRRDGGLLAVYVAGYGLGRFWVEGLRIDRADELAGLRWNQWVAAVAVVGGVAMALRALRRGAPESSSVTSPGGSDGPPVA